MEILREIFYREKQNVMFLDTDPQWKEPFIKSRYNFYKSLYSDCEPCSLFKKNPLTQC